ncbi:MAG: DNA topoisomerase IV subunit A [Bacilli bacterium]|nr:DNA topoisomerase IV subunit A [Bacilli bacterium]
MKDILAKIYDYSLEEIMGERFGRYSKYIIQDRAIPDVRDGLKPVQRRILYAMYKDKNTYDKPYRKSVKTVGNVIGNYHPHGDSSVYDAMVRMSQDWKQKNPYIEMHGNNGSIDGDSAAAMRYTEARLSKISNELLRDIDKDTVIMAPNFDDTTLEPTVLPSKFPNLLVNGTSGISAGYATNIPPHNLGEIIEATIKRIDNPNCRLDTIMNLVKGPDFPTGGIVEGLDGILSAYKTGKGKVIVKGRTNFEKTNGKEQLVITEIPYDVNKATLIKKIDEIRLDKKIEGIIEVRDESDKDGLRIAIDLKRDANKELVLNYLLKNTDLQMSFNFNMVAIVNRRPKQLGLIEILDAYIEHQKEVVTLRTEFDLRHAKARLHIVEGLIKALSILDDVIKTIRASKNKSDAKDNLVNQYGFTDSQAEAIVTLQLYKLTNTDVTLLEEELTNLNTIISGLTEILNNEETLKLVIKTELRNIKKEYDVPRLTTIYEEVTEIKIDEVEMIPKENVIVVVTNEGYVKRVSLKSYALSPDEETTLKDGDFVIGQFEMVTTDTILLFTDLGNYLYVPVYEIFESKWKEIGKHISNIIDVKSAENIIGAIPVYDFNNDMDITIFTKKGMVKRSNLKDYEVQRYSKPISTIKLKDNDLVTNISYSDANEVFITTRGGYGLWFDKSEIPVVGTKASGVKSINLKDDIVTNGIIFSKDDEYLSIVTNKGTGKRIKLSEFTKTSRAKRGVQIIRDIKTNPHLILKSFILDPKDEIGLKIGEKIVMVKLTELPITDRYSAGSLITKSKINAVFNDIDLIKKDMIIANEGNKEISREDVSLSDVDKKMMTIADFLDDFNV